MSQVPVPADKHFRRARVKPTRQRRRQVVWTGRMVRYALLAVVLVAGAYRGAVIVAQAHVLQIDHIDVRGNARISSGEVLALLSGLRGQSLLWSDLEGWRQRLLASPWVQAADLRRSLPSTVDVFVAERVPVGIGRIDDQLYLVDEHGVLIDEYGPQYAELDLPIIDGLPAPGDSGTTDPVRMELVARVVRSLAPQPEIAGRLSQVNVRDVHNVTVILSGDSAAVQLGDQQFLARLESYLELAPTLRARVSGIDTVDLRVDGRVYVRPGPAPPKTGARAPQPKR